MKRKLMVLVVVLLISTLLVTGCEGKKEEELIVGGKNFTEQFIMAEMLGMLIEENTDIDLSIQTNLAANVIMNAIKSDQVDLYLEYTGTGLTDLGIEPISDPKEAYEVVKKEFDEQYNIKWMKPYGFNNTYALMVTQETAEKYNLKTISDMAKIANELTLGSTYIFKERDDGYPGVSKHYDFKFADVKGMDPSLMYQAVVQGEVDVISGFATDGRMAAFGLVILEDDQQFFPPYDATVIIRGEILEQYPELEEIVNQLVGRIDDNKMAELNAAADLDKREPADIAREFLEEEGLIKK